MRPKLKKYLLKEPIYANEEWDRELEDQVWKALDKWLGELEGGKKEEAQKAKEDEERAKEQKEEDASVAESKGHKRPLIKSWLLSVTCCWC